MAFPQKEWESELSWRNSKSYQYVTKVKMFHLCPVCLQSSCVSSCALRLLVSFFLPFRSIGISVMLSFYEHSRGGAIPVHLSGRHLFRLKQSLEFVNLCRFQLLNCDQGGSSHSSLGGDFREASLKPGLCLNVTLSGSRAPSIHVAWHKAAPLPYVTSAERVFTVY